jgi:SPP1 gp7 family putative phage head morphogenesis protein
VLARAFRGLWRRARAELADDVTLRAVAARKDMEAFGDPSWWQAAREAEMAQVRVSALALLEQGAQQAGWLGLPVDFDLIHQEALALADEYMDVWWEQFTRTTQAGLRSGLRDFISTGGSLRDLTQQLAPFFGDKRAKVIAATETTRLFAEGNRRAYASSGVVDAVEWRTANDERVDGRCAALLQTRWALGFEEEVPPLHPQCRCWLAPVVCVPTLEGVREKQEGCEPILEALAPWEIPSFNPPDYTYSTIEKDIHNWVSSPDASGAVREVSGRLLANPIRVGTSSPIDEQMAARLLTALKREGKKYTTLYRGIGGSIQETVSGLLELKPGEIFNMPLSSFSMSQKVADGFGKIVQIELMDARGLRVKKWGNMLSDVEKEVIVAGGFEVVAVSKIALSPTLNGVKLILRAL